MTLWLVIDVVLLGNDNDCVISNMLELVGLLAWVLKY